MGFEGSSAEQLLGNIRRKMPMVCLYLSGHTDASMRDQLGCYYILSTYNLREMFGLKLGWTDILAESCSDSLLAPLIYRTVATKDSVLVWSLLAISISILLKGHGREHSSSWRICTMICRSFLLSRSDRDKTPCIPPLSICI